MILPKNSFTCIQTYVKQTGFSLVGCVQRTSSVALISMPLSKLFLMECMTCFIPVDFPLPLMPINTCTAERKVSVYIS